MKDHLMDTARHMELYNRRKSNGLCVDCGEAPAVDGRVRCQSCIDKRNIHNKDTERKEYHRSYMADLRAWRKGRFLCTECGGQDARTLAGNSLCFDCREKKTERTRRNVDAKAKEYANAKERRKAFVEAGFCSECGKRKPDSGYKMCSVCRAKSRQQQKKRRDTAHQNDLFYGIPRIQWPDLGYCYICKAPLDGVRSEWTVQDDRSRLCKDCYNKLIRAGEKGWANAKEKGVFSPAKGVDEFWRLRKAEQSARAI